MIQAFLSDCDKYYVLISPGVGFEEALGGQNSRKKKFGATNRNRVATNKNLSAVGLPVRLRSNFAWASL